MYKVLEAGSQKEIDDIIDLRYEVLRLPWNQPRETASDELEQTSVNAYIAENGKVIACGRLQKNSEKTGQIRYMAVSNSHQGKGLGKLIVQFLEEKGKESGFNSIELQARENAVDFYKSCGYSIIEKTFLLWGKIQHYLMSKEIKN